MKRLFPIILILMVAGGLLYGADTTLKSSGKLEPGKYLKVDDKGQVVSGKPSYSSLVVSNDLYTVPWTDYSATSTVTGWASTTEKCIHYKRVGKLVFVIYRVVGTSNSTSTSFTLPYAATASPTTYHIVVPQRIQDNGSFSNNGIVIIAASGSTAIFYATAAAGAWTNSGTKGIYGEFFYHIS